MEISLSRFLFLSKVDHPAVHAVSTHWSPSVTLSGDSVPLDAGPWHTRGVPGMELVETNDFLSIRRVQGMPPTHSVPGGPYPDRERDPVAFQLILRWAGSLHLGGAGLS